MRYAVAADTRDPNRDDVMQTTQVKERSDQQRSYKDVMLYIREVSGICQPKMCV